MIPKPAFFQNQELGELLPIERLAFIGMWTIADFRGCIELKSKRLKIQILPYDDCDIDSIVTNLDKARFIRIYSVRGQRHIKIINFEKHQNPHKNEREAGSEIPDISEAEEKPNEIKELIQDGIKPDLIGSPRAESLFLNPSSLIPDSLNLIPDPLTLPATPAGVGRRKGPRAEKELRPTAETWKAYAEAYEARYGTPPVRNATVNSQMVGFVGRIGQEESPAVAAWFVGNQNRFYVETGHSVGMLARDAEKLRTEWANGRRLTATQAMQADKTATNASVFGKLIDEAKQQEIANAIR